VTQCSRQLSDIARVCEQRRVTSNLAECRPVGGDDRHAKGHCLKHRQAKSLGQGWETQAARRLYEMIRQLLPIRTQIHGLIGDSQLSIG